MTRDEALAELRAIAERQGPPPDRGNISEGDHEEADRVILRLLDDDEITSAWERVGKWFG
jgi:hypothetical protein